MPSITPSAIGAPDASSISVSGFYRVDSTTIKNWIHTDAVYETLLSACGEMETRLEDSLKLYKEHPDVQANLQQLQYDLQQWNLALTTLTNIQKNMHDALNSIASNFR